MSLLRRNKAEKAQATPAPAPTPTPPSNKAPQASFVSRARQWLIDSYNGLYKVVLEPSMPHRFTVIALVVGVAIGLFWGYNINPTVFNGANPNRLNQGGQDQWIAMVGANYLTGFYSAEQAAQLLNRVSQPAQAVERLLTNPNLSDADRQAIQSVQGIAANVSGTPTPQSAGFVGELLQFLFPLILFMILFPIATLVYRLLIEPNLVAPAFERVREMRDPELRAKNERSRAELKILQEQRAELERLKSETVADADLGEPVMQALKVYTKGRNFDESNEIEAGDNFLGQCGAVIPETVNGDPVAVEIWLFDMFATGDQNHKRLFVSPSALQDASLRARLSSDPDVNEAEFVPASVGAKLVIDSEKVRLQADLSSVEVGEDGRFSSFRMKMTAWDKSVLANAMPAMPSYNPPPAPSYNPPPVPSYNPPPAPSYNPPPAPSYNPPPVPSYNPPPASTGSRPLSEYDDISFDPPPSLPPRPLAPPPMGGYEDEDPFGGTGDFTPMPPRK